MELKKLIVLSACLLLLASCKQETRQVEGNGYKLMELGTSDRELSVKYSTTLQGRQDVEIRPQVSGTITQVLVKEGAKVRKGQTLFVGSSLMEIFPIEKWEEAGEVTFSHYIYNRAVRATTTSFLLEHIESQIFNLEPSKIFINIGDGTYNYSFYLRRL